MSHALWVCVVPAHMYKYINNIYQGYLIDSVFMIRRRSIMRKFQKHKHEKNIKIGDMTAEGGTWEPSRT
jgi:uncharacterized membrane protein (DUF106 family)